jgi:2,4-dienoyl-CoA reductase-like NADH-dependent reductase (Old Yellow Enzyme family)
LINAQADKTLFDKTQCGAMALKNRFIRAAVGDDSSNGYVNDDMLDLYEKIARGGVGTIITGYTLIDEAERSYNDILAFYDDSFFDGHKKLVDLARSYNVNIVLQLVYIGAHSSVAFHNRYKDLNDKITILAPSAIENVHTGVLPKEISVSEIKKIEQKFAAAALRAKEVGYSGVEIHAAHGFFLSQFMSPYYNRRTDQYGGSTQNMARISLETYDAIRSAVGIDFTVWIKINVMDDNKVSVVFDDVLYLCKELTNKGINAIEISGSWRSVRTRGAYFQSEAEKIAELNDTAIILTGGNRDFNKMANILNQTKIRYFGLARPLIKEPNMINIFEKEYKRRQTND